MQIELGSLYRSTGKSFKVVEVLGGNVKVVVFRLRVVTDSLINL